MAATLLRGLQLGRGWVRVVLASLVVPRVASLKVDVANIKRPTALAAVQVWLALGGGSRRGGFVYQKEQHFSSKPHGSGQVAPSY